MIKKILLMIFLLVSSNTFTTQEEQANLAFSNDDKQFVLKKVLESASLKRVNEMSLEEMHEVLQSFFRRICETNKGDIQRLAQELLESTESGYKAKDREWFEKAYNYFEGERLKYMLRSFTSEENESFLQSECQESTPECQRVRKAIASILEGNTLTEKQRQYTLKLQELTNQ